MIIQDVVIVGAGLVGATAARSLRSRGYQGRITLIGDEPEYPYDRTTLSKSVLAGERDAPPNLILPEWYDAEHVNVRLGERVEKIDIAYQRVQLESGETILYDKLLLAMGARARPLSVGGSDLNGIYSLRTHADSVKVRRQLKPNSSLVIVGGGLIGCEVATTACKAGVNVMVLECANELLLRVLGAQTGKWLRTELEQRGVNIQLDAQVARFEGNGSVDTVVCADGRRFSADMVLVSIGAEPACELARDAGIDCSRGVLVNSLGETSCPHVYAAGDVASWPLRDGGRRSLETYLNGTAQADVVVSAILEKPDPTMQIPTSWTEIAGHQIQMVGDPAGEGEIVKRGEFANGQPKVIFRILNGHVKATVSIDSPKEFSVATRLVASSCVVTKEQLQDVGVNLRTLLAAKSAENVC